MLNNRLVVVLVATNVITYAIAVSMARALAQQQRRYNGLHKMSEYLIHVMDEHGIGISEFDAIALKALMEEHNVSKG